VIKFFSIIILSILGSKMNKLYLAMLCTLFGSGSIYAGIGDFPTVSDDMLKDGERIIYFTDTEGKGYAAISKYKIDSNVLAPALLPSNRVYDLRELQRPHPWIMRCKGMLGLVVGVIVGAKGLELISNLYYEAPQIDK
jgi:hypothetical protein